MNRRTFLKSIATVCGAAVVCPGELLKSEPEWMKYAKTWDKLLKDKPHPAQRVYVIDHPVFIKARQQGCTNSILYGIPYWCGISTCVINNKSAPFIIGAHDEKIQTTK